MVFFFSRMELVLIVGPLPSVFVYGKVHSFPRFVSLESPLFKHCPKCFPFTTWPVLLPWSSAVSCICSCQVSMRTQVIKITDWSAFSQIGFDPKPWNDFWAFVNLALKLKWFGQHDSVWWIIYQSGSANCLRRKSVDFMEERLASVTYNRLWGFEWFGFTNT